MSQRDLQTLKKADRNKLAWSLRVSGLLSCPLQELPRRITDIADGMSGKKCRKAFAVDDKADPIRCERPKGHEGPCGQYGKGEAFELQLVLRGSHDVEDEE